ncbi:MAG: DUF3857 domain-containing protein, partial [Paludibacter sp.]|nr:DUF3857 domain-containing protein [Paludibacter sp.]
MKKIASTLIALCICCTATYGQEKFKFGTCPVELLQQTSYELDADAAAYVVYEQKEVYYTYSPKLNDFEIVTDYAVRVKILTQEGVDKYGNASIVFYKGISSFQSESITNLIGYTYNLENDKVVREKLEKNYIFVEDVSKNIKRQKFAFPAVKIGSVVEYKYRHSSPHIYNLADFEFQWSIPVQYGEFMLRVPQYFTFNRETTGYETPDVKTEKINESIMLNDGTLYFTAEEIRATVRNFPALKSEPYLWNVRDFASKMTFDIKSIQIPGSYYKNFSNKWSDVVDKLMDADDFGKEFGNKFTLKTELPAALEGKENTLDSIRAVLNLVRSRVKFNDRSTMWVEDDSRALRDGVGSSAEINCILLNALKNAGFTAYPVAMSLRSRGRIPLTHPSVNCFNYFIVSVYHGGKIYYLDGTKPYTDINVIPVDCLVDRAMIIHNPSFEWVDLTATGNNLNRINMLLSFDSVGVLTGQIREVYQGEMAYQFKSNYNNSENEEKYIESTESRKAIEMSDYQL